MNQNTNNVAQNSSDKSQWTSPEVWDLAVGRTQGGPFPASTEGLPVSGTATVDGVDFPFTSTTGTENTGGIDLGGAS